MSASLESIEAYQHRIIAGQVEILATLGGLVRQVNDHEARLGKLEDASGTDASPRVSDHETRLARIEDSVPLRLDALETASSQSGPRLDDLERRQGRHLRVLLWLFPAACVVSAFAGAWAALHL